MGLDFYVSIDRDKAICVNLDIYDGSDVRWLFGKAKSDEALTTTHTSQRYVCDAVDSCDVCPAVLDAFSAADDDENFGRDFSNTVDYRSCGNYERLLKEVVPFGGQWCLIKNRKSLMGIYSDKWHAQNTEHYNARKRMGIVLVRMTYKDRSIGVGRVLTSFIDLDVIRNWRDTCDRQHAEKCSPHLIGLPPVHIPWFIDTYDRCIVAGSENQRYIALSYRWGVSGKAQLTTETLQGLKKKGSLGSCGKSSLPKTILNAMDLCQAIGERCLWADTLCIPQDDNMVRQRMISNMTAVYANASMTIIAADGEHADHGLRGVPGEFQIPREPVKLLDGPLGGQFFLKPMKSLDDTEWNSRGWTFQEYAFSPRRLIFLQDTVRWECCQACCWEEIEEPGEAPLQISKRKSASMLEDRIREESVFYDSDISDIRHAPILPLPPYPDLALLGHLASAYNRRDLSFDRDAHGAFAGILTAMNTTFLGGFVWGIPVMFFDHVLTWSSRTGAEVKDLRPRSTSCPEDIIPPKWTWMGWQGPLSDDSWENDQYIFKKPEYPNQMRLWIVPITTWYTQSHKTAERRQIPDQNKWYEYRKKFVGIDDQNLLPPGWTAHRISLSDPSSEEVAPGPSTDTGLGHTAATVAYTHIGLGDAMQFWHPIPLREPIGETASSTPGMSQPVDSDRRYLVCKAEQAQLCPSMTRSMIPGHETNYKVPLTVKGSDDIICRLTPDIEGSWGNNIREVSVVAVSGGYKASFPAVSDKERIEYYNVLCVSWEDGVAYRRGVGTVSQTVWESLERETVDLVLG